MWDAWAGARPDAAPDDWWARPDAGAGKSAVLAPDVLAPDAWELPWRFRRHRRARPAARAPYTLDAARSAERSFAAAALPAVRARLERLVGQPWLMAGPEKQVAAAAELPALCCWPKVAEPATERPVAARLEPLAQPIEEEPALER